MRSLRWLIALMLLALVAAACGGDDDDDAGGDTSGGTGDGEPAEFTLFGAPTGVEGDAMTGFIEAYNTETGSNISYTGSDDFETQLQIRVEGNDPPDVAFVPQPASICVYAGEGHLASLEDMGFDIAEMEANHGKFWMDLGLCEDGSHYGIPWFPNFKSTVFYHQPTFEENGYEVPETYEDLVALSEQIVADGMTPWCFGFEAGTATGWAGTDWIEDIVVRQVGADVYTQWYQGEVPFTDPQITQAFDAFGEILHGEGFVLGGAENVPSINVDDSPGPLFQDPPGCLMLKQGSFIANVFADMPEFEEGEDAEIAVFPFPTIDGNGGAMGGGDTLIVFNDEPANVQAVMDWITPEWLCTLASETGGGIAEHGGHGVPGVQRLPGHKDVDPNCYETEAAIAFAETITEALGSNTFVFDASDLMPPEVGQRSFWDGMVTFAQGTPTAEVTEAIQAAWPAS